MLGDIGWGEGVLKNVKNGAISKTRPVSHMKCSTGYCGSVSVAARNSHSTKSDAD